MNLLWLAAGPAEAPSTEEIKGLVQRIAEQIDCSLEPWGLITLDIENPYPAFDPSEEPPSHGLPGHSITCLEVLRRNQPSQVIWSKSVSPGGYNQVYIYMADSSDENVLRIRRFTSKG